MVGGIFRDHHEIRDKNADDSVNLVILVAGFYLFHHHLGGIEQHPFPDGTLRLYLHFNINDFAGAGVDFDIQDAKFVFNELPVQIGVNHRQFFVILSGQVQNRLEKVLQNRHVFAEHLFEDEIIRG